MGGKSFGATVARQVLINVAAALLAAWIIEQSPQLRAWLKQSAGSPGCTGCAGS